MSLERLFAGMESGFSSDSEPKSPPEVLCTTLREVFERYSAPCPFKAGDLVTPRSSANLTGAGNPHIVLEVLDRPEPNFAIGGDLSDVGTPLFGARRDMRVLTESRGKIVPHWVESFNFDPYVPPETPRSAA